MINQVAIIVTITAIMTSILITFFPSPAHAQGTTKELPRIQIPSEETSVPKTFCVDPARCNHHGNPAGLNTTSASNMTGAAGNTTGSNMTAGANTTLGTHGQSIPSTNPPGARLFNKL
jgi:hypothetical protein